MRTQKTIVSALALSLITGAAQAQTEAGKLLVSGQINYSQSKGESTSTSTTTFRQESKQSSFNFVPQLGFFVADNLAVGIRGGIGSSKQTQQRNDDIVSGTYSSTRRSNTAFIGPFIRYYKMIDEKWGFYGQLSGGYQRLKDTSSTDYPNFNGANYSYKTKSTGGYGTLLPGFVFFPSKKVGLELTVGSLSYDKIKSKQQDTQTQASQGNFEGSSSSFGANFGLQYLAIGASFHLGN